MGGRRLTAQCGEFHVGWGTGRGAPAAIGPVMTGATWFRWRDVQPNVPTAMNRWLITQATI
jgi:hypothetical protein